MTLSITFYDNIKYHRQDFINRDLDFIGNGVVNLTDFPITYPSPASLTLQLGQGTAWVDGYRIANDSNLVSLTVPNADVSYPRIDIIQIGHDDINSTYSLVVKKGVAASSPVEPGADPGYFKLYAISVAANATSITSANVTDRRSLVPLKVSGTQIQYQGAASNGTNTFSGTQTAPEFSSTGKVDWSDSVNNTKSYAQQVNGDLWITVNAYYDGTHWQRVDTTKFAFAIQMQGTNNIPGESVQGLNIWRCVPGSNPILGFTQYGGWETCLIFTGNQNMVVGGENLEIDGSGASTQYGRINQIADGTFFSKNAFFDGTNWQRDDTSKPASAIRIGPDGSIKTYFVAAGANPITWQINNILDDGSGNFGTIGKISKIKNVATAGNFGVSIAVDNASDVQLTSTSETTIAQFTPTVQGNFEAKVYYRVVTGTTNVTVKITYTDASGAQTNTVLNAQSSAVGSYSCLPVFFNATPGSAIQVKVTASVANQVYASAVIVGW